MHWLDSSTNALKRVKQNWVSLVRKLLGKRIPLRRGGGALKRKCPWYPGLNNRRIPSGANASAAATPPQDRTASYGIALATVRPQSAGHALR